MVNILDRNKFKRKLNYICKTYGISSIVADKIISAVDRSMYPIIDLRGDRWISVKDHLPPEKGAYLCYYNYEATLGSPDVICENTYLGTGHWQSDENVVTHWMPLVPKPIEFDYVEDI